jgi:hypothetical protein
MRSSAIFQIVSTLASLALITLPTATEALPVRGALGNLGARARAAKRAAHHHAQMAAAAEPAPEKRFKVTTEGRRPANVRKAKVVPAVVEKREVSVADAVLPPVAQFKARPIQKAFPNPKAFLIANATTVGDNVKSNAPE